MPAAWSSRSTRTVPTRSFAYSMTSVPGNRLASASTWTVPKMLGGKSERLGQAGQDEAGVAEHGLANGDERIGNDFGRLAAKRHAVLGVLDRAPDVAGEARPGLVEAVHHEEGLGHTPPCEFRSRGLEKPGEDPLAARARMDHSADLSLVGAVAVEAEKADEAVLSHPQEVVGPIRRPRLENAPLELEASTVRRDAGCGEVLDGAEILRP